jgi:uncharacterized membrane protein (DUF4010 family)
MENFIFTLIDPSNQVYQLLIAIFLGTFIGLRREMIFQKEKVEGIMGLRTVSIFVLLGTISTFFKEFPSLPLVTFIGVFMFMIVAYYNGVFNLKRVGLTSEIIVLIMFWVGVLVGKEEIILAVILTIIIGIFTAYKENLHSFAKGFSVKEWSGALQLLIVTALVLPLLPREAIDPFGILIPFDIWLLVIFMSSIGFFGYFFDKYFSNKKSLLATSFFGSIVSSTIVATSLAIKSKKNKNLNLLASAVMLSITVMQLRILIEILVLSKEFHLQFILPSIVMAIISISFAFYFFKITKTTKKVEYEIAKKIEIKSPFEIIPSIKFAAFFIVILFAIYFGKKYFGNLGAYVATFFASFSDADAVVLSILESFKNTNSEESFVSKIILIAITVNTLVKILYTFILGSNEFFQKILLPILTVCFIGVLSYLALILSFTL